VNIGARIALISLRAMVRSGFGKVAIKAGLTKALTRDKADLTVARVDSKSLRLRKATGRRIKIRKTSLMRKACLCLLEPVVTALARSAPVQGSLDAERSLLALYLTSREDYDVVYSRLTEETLLNAPHQEIKEALEGIGSNFNTMEDLQTKLMDRVAPVPVTARALVDIIYKAEDFRKQKPPVQVVLKESRARILKERLDLLSAAVRREMTSADENGSDQSTLQSRMMELTKLEHELPKLESLEQIEEFKKKIDTSPDNESLAEARCNIVTKYKQIRSNTSDGDPRE
jgi:hypothetical protein